MAPGFGNRERACVNTDYPLVVWFVAPNVGGLARALNARMVTYIPVRLLTSLMSPGPILGVSSNPANAPEDAP